MHALSDREFLVWAGDRGVELDPQWSTPGEQSWLRLQHQHGPHRLWFPPEEPPDGGAGLTFANGLLQALGPWETCGLLKRAGNWDYSDVPADGGSILHAIGVPNSPVAALVFDNTEYAALLLVLTVQLTFGGSVCDDFWIVPDHGDALLLTTHDGEVHVDFRHTAAAVRFSNQMTAAGFEPSDEPSA